MPRPLTIRLSCLLALLLVLGGCTGSTTDCAPTAGQPAPLPVIVQVVQDDQGQGNPLWTQPYIERVLLYATQHVDQAVQFVLEARQEVWNSARYAMNQHDLLYTACEGVVGFLEVMISNPATTDSAGQSKQTAPGALPVNPCVVMRSRFTDATEQALDQNALILLHELGHNLGYQHTYDQPIHTDSYWLFDSGKQALQALAQALAGARGCQVQ